jgi:hypothetical protein
MQIEGAFCAHNQPIERRGDVLLVRHYQPSICRAEQHPCSGAQAQRIPNLKKRFIPKLFCFGTQRPCQGF